MTLSELIAHLRSMEGKATKGRWFLTGYDSLRTRPDGSESDSLYGSIDMGSCNIPIDDLRFLVAVRNSLPRILAAMEAQKEELQAWRALNHIDHEIGMSIEHQTPERFVAAQRVAEARTALSKLEGE